MAQRVLSATDIATRGMRHRKEPYDARVPRGTGRADGSNPGFGLALFTGITGAAGLPGPSNPLTDDWPIDDANNYVQLGYWRKAPGWEKYKAAVIAKYPAAATQTYAGGVPAIVETTTTELYGETADVIGFNGTAALVFLSLFDRVILIHGAPPKVLQRIKQYSRVGTKIGLWTMTNWMATGPYYSAFTEPPREWLRANGHFNFGTPVTTSHASAVAIVSGGTGYTVQDVLTVSGGTPVNSVRTTIRVSAVSGGVITGAVLTGAGAGSGAYTTAPVNTVSVTGGTGSAATFNMTYLTTSNYTTVDPYYGGNWAGGVVSIPSAQGARNVSSGHLWFWDVASDAARQGVANTLRNMWDTYWKVAWDAGIPNLDFFHSDNYPNSIIGNHPWSNATNIAARTWAVTNTYWEDLSAKITAALATSGMSLPYMSANNAGSGGGLTGYGAPNHPNLKLQYWEHSFLSGDNQFYYTQAQILAGLATSLASPVREVYVGSHRQTLESIPPPPVGSPLPGDGQIYQGIRQFETADHPDLRAMRAMIGSRTNYFIMLPTFGANADGMLYHGPTVRPLI